MDPDDTPPRKRVPPEPAKSQAVGPPPFRPLRGAKSATRKTPKAEPSGRIFTIWQPSRLAKFNFFPAGFSEVGHPCDHSPEPRQTSPPIFSGLVRPSKPALPEVHHAGKRRIRSQRCPPFRLPGLMIKTPEANGARQETIQRFSGKLRKVVSPFIPHARKVNPSGLGHGRIFQKNGFSGNGNSSHGGLS